MTTCFSFFTSPRQLILPLSVLIFFTCSDKYLENEHSYLFKPIENVHFNKLEKIGFSKSLGSDIPMLEYNFRDTGTVVIFDFDQVTLLQTKWFVKVDFEDGGCVEKFLHANDAYIDHGSDEIMSGEAFYVRHALYNAVYECNYSSDTKELVIIYYHTNF